MEPAPFVLEKALGDFAVTYELNVYCADVQAMDAALCRAAPQHPGCVQRYGVQIMTPAYEGDPPEPKIVPREGLVRDARREPGAGHASIVAGPADGLAAAGSRTGATHARRRLPPARPLRNLGWPPGARTTRRGPPPHAPASPLETACSLVSAEYAPCSIADCQPSRVGGRHTHEKRAHHALRAAAPRYLRSG